MDGEHTRLTDSGARLCGILVTYNPDRMLRDALTAAVAQLETVYVVDNSQIPQSESFVLREVERCRALSGTNKCILFQNGRNTGIDHAINQGLAAAAKEGFSGALVLDQDSILTDGAIDALASAFTVASRQHRVGIVCARNVEIYQGRVGAPNWYERLKSVFHLIRGGERLNDIEETFFCVYSGSLINLQAVADVGPTCEEYFIDADDKEFCFRLRSKGWKILSAPAAIVRHLCGTVDTDQPDGLAMAGFTDHVAWRHYYIARNTLVTWKRYVRRFPTDATVMLFIWWLFLWITIGRAKDRLPIVTFTVRGYRDFLRHRMGPAEFS